MSITDRIGEGISTLKTKLKAPFNVRSAVDDIERVEKKAAEESFLKTGAADFGDSIQAEGARRAVLRQVLAKDPDFFMLPPEITESIVKFKDLQRGGANAPDPLVVFRNLGQFTDEELKKIDFIIDQKLFDDTSVIADDVLEYIKEIRPQGFRPGFSKGKLVAGLEEEYYGPQKLDWLKNFSDQMTFEEYLQMISMKAAKGGLARILEM